MTAKNVQAVTKAEFVKAYRQAEANATVSAGGLAFTAEDRLTLNAMRVSLGYDFTQAADAVSVNPADYARHWQRFQHWAKQIQKGQINVAPQADEIADRSHKHPVRNSKNRTKKEAQLAQRTSPKGQPRPEVKEVAKVAVETAESKAEALHQLGMIFASREEAEAHLQQMMYGLVRLGMDDMDALVPSLQAKLIKAKQEIELEAQARAVLAALTKAGSQDNAQRILDMARSLMP